MKTILIILTSLTISLGAAAQRKGGYYHSYHPRIYVAPLSVGVGLGYPYFGSPFYGNPYYGNPYGNPYGYTNRRLPYKLSLQIQDIKADYKLKIKEERHDKTVSGKERRKNIRNLKDERDQDVIDAQRNFRTRRMNNQNQGNNRNNNSNSNQDQYQDNS